MRLSRDHLWSANAGALGTSVEACRLEATEARGKPLPMLRPGLKSHFEGGSDFAKDSKGKCIHTLAFVFLDFTRARIRALGRSSAAGAREGSTIHFELSFDDVSILRSRK